MSKYRMSGLFDFWKRKPEPQVPPIAVPVNVDLYAILGVPPSASADEIRQAYRELAKKFHPDRNPDDPVAAEKFVEISRATDFLTTPEIRAAYDEARGVGQRPKKEEPRRYPDIPRRMEVPEKPSGEKKFERPKAKAPEKGIWDIMFERPPEGEGYREGSIFEAFPPSQERPSSPEDWNWIFSFGKKIRMPSPEKLVESVKKLPLAEIWTFVRKNREAPEFEKSKSMVIGPIAGMGGEPVEHDVAVLAGIPFEDVADYVDLKGLERTWEEILGPLLDEVVFAIESMKPADIPGYFYFNWDPSGKMLELLYGEAR
jgi:curved DNA-binding protein CbpA